MAEPWIERLRAAEARLARERLSPRATRRVARSMAAAMTRGARVRPYLTALAFAAGAALVLLVVGAKALRPTAVPAQPASVASGADCRDRDEAGVLVLDGTCTVELTAQSVRVETRGPTLIGRVDAATVEIARGEALFDVMPREGEILRVLVPGGVIEVVGTRFRVVAWSTGGTVELLEGRVRFVDARGVTWLAPGQVLAFGVARTPSTLALADPAPPQPASVPAPAPAPAPAAPATALTERPIASTAPRRPASSPPRADPPAADDADAIVADVRRLRADGRYDVAAARLRDALSRSWPPRTAEILSYELGTILARHLADGAGACAHWADHLQRFPDGRYADAIARSRAKLACVD